MNCSAIIIATLSFLATTCFSEVDDGSVLHCGEATFYGDGGGGNCGFIGETQPLYHGAMNHTDYDSSAACGTWVHIIGHKGEVTAFIDDRCPECKPGDIDLGPGTFEAIADKALGRAPITWRYVEAPVSGPIEYYWQSGSSTYHIAVQIRNHRYGIMSVEIRTDTGAWILLDRSYDNFFFRYGGLGGAPGPYILRVTDIYGRQLVDTFADILQGHKSAGALNFDAVATVRRPAMPVGTSRRGVSVKVTKAVVVNGRFLTTTGLSDAVHLYSLSGRSLGKFATRPDEKAGEASCAGRYGMVIVVNDPPPLR